MGSNGKNGFERTCFKRKLKTKRAAKKVLSSTKKKGREEIRYYFCMDCEAWHLTSKKRKLLFCEEVERCVRDE